MNLCSQGRRKKLGDTWLEGSLTKLQKNVEGSENDFFQKAWFGCD